MKKNSGKMQKVKKSGSSQKPITWLSKSVKAKDINPTPGNYKIKTKLGKERLQTSLKKFGRAGTVVCNYSTKKGKWDLIDGNSRWEDVMSVNPEALMEISIPSRPLSPSEYKEMAAMFDFATAGDVDIERIKGDLGKTADFFEKWGIETPKEILNQMGKNAIADNYTEEEIEEDKKKTKKKGLLPPPPKEVQVVINLIFTESEEKQFRGMEEKLGKLFKEDDVSKIVLKAMKKSIGK